MIPHAILSDRLEACVQGRRIVAGLFLTFEFDPGFFEQEVLPVMLNLSVSHGRGIRLVQLEDALRACAGNLAVFYDSNHLVKGSAGSAHLDVRRIAVRHPSGVFHPKNILLLVEAQEPDENGHRRQALIVGAMSANLTRSGWWENVEAAHFEEIPEFSPNRMRDDLLTLFRLLYLRAGVGAPYLPVETIRKFVLDTEQRQNRSSAQTLHSHFYSGDIPFPDFLESCAGSSIRGMHLEVISPYLDEGPGSAPLQRLMELFQPNEVRIMLPRDREGRVTCSPQTHAAIAGMTGVTWGSLPREHIRNGSRKDALSRFVHAKVYRFFSQKPKREICFIGSVNLTTPAHHSPKSNWETGILMEVECPRAPDFWLEADTSKPVGPVAENDDESSKEGGTPLILRYFWDTAVAEVYWDQDKASPELRLTMRGTTLASLSPLPSRKWVPLVPEATLSLAELLKETSFVEVIAKDGPTGLLLIQEENMAHKPSILLSLSTADILRYWSLLTTDQRAAFIESRTLDLAGDQEGAHLLSRVELNLGTQTFFDRFAGIFHAFSCVENAVRESLSAKPPRLVEADYRLFGRKYDSLGTLLERVFTDGALSDEVERYILMLCAQQMVRELGRDFADYWQDRREQAAPVLASLSRITEIRQKLAGNASSKDMPAFLDWFDVWFLKRAHGEQINP
jgi:hypothetical protein